MENGDETGEILALKSGSDKGSDQAAEVTRGRLLVIIIGLVMIGMTLELLDRDASMIAVPFILVLWAGLCYFLYKGKNWARWLLIIDQFARGVFGLFGAAALILLALSSRGAEGVTSTDVTTYLALGVISLLLSAAIIVIGILLLRSPSIKAFLDYQNSGHKAKQPA